MHISLRTFYMEHHFEVDHAIQYGIEEAIIISNFSFWIRKNRANKANTREIEIDGKLEKRTFTYNSANAMSELFPYLNPKQIYRVMDSLEKQEVLVKRNFNSNRYDRTLWYCFKNEETFLGIVKTNSRKEEMESDGKKNQFPKSGNHYTDNKPDNKPDKEIKEPEIELPKIKSLSEQLQELAEKNNIPYTDDVRQDNNFHSKLMLEIKNCTNEKILERANQFVSIAKRDKKPSWVLTNKLGFKTLKFKWDDIEMEYKAGKAHNAHPRPIKVKETLYDESRAGIVPTYEELQRMYSDV